MINNEKHLSPLKGKHKEIPYEVTKEGAVKIDGEEIRVELQGTRYWTPLYGFMEFPKIEDLIKTVIEKNPKYSK